VAVDGSGYVYVADWNDLIRKISPDGEVTTLAGEAGQTNEWGGVEGGYADGAGAAARFHSPYGVALDKARNLYVTDAHNNCIRKVTPDGVVTTLAGKPGCDGNTDGTGSEARFTLVERGWLFCIWAGIAVDENGTLYVADSGGGPLNFFEDWNSRWPSTIRVGVKAGPDRPILDLPLAPVGVQRQLDTAPRTATAWQWSQLRRPAGSQAELSSTATPNPTFTPDVADLYVFQLLATNALTGEASLRTLELNAVPADVAVLVSPQRRPDGSFQLTLIGQASQSYTLQVSSDLLTWTDWVNVTPESCSTPVTDPEAAQGTQRFYRARTR